MTAPRNTVAERAPVPTATLADTGALQDRLGAIVGAEQVLVDPGQRTFFTTDLAGSGEQAKAVVRVNSTAEVAGVVGECVRAGIAVIPRGGGFCYTGGYTPMDENSVTIDLRGIDQVFEINETDMYVRVGVGCTWHNLYIALKARVLRTPYFGPMSSYSATVGGALSQGSFFLGSTEYGTVIDSVLSAAGAAERLKQVRAIALANGATELAPSGPRVRALRDELKVVMHEHGAVHVQIGRVYDLLGTREPRVAELLKDNKRALDPQRLVNPGSLGL